MYAAREKVVLFISPNRRVVASMKKEKTKEEKNSGKHRILVFAMRKTKI